LVPSEKVEWTWIAQEASYIAFHFNAMGK
jgi:hypothetical protein